MTELASVLFRSFLSLRILGMLPFCFFLSFNQADRLRILILSSWAVVGHQPSLSLPSATNESKATRDSQLVLWCLTAALDVPPPRLFHFPFALVIVESSLCLAFVMEDAKHPASVVLYSFLWFFVFCSACISVLSMYLSLM